MKRPSQGPGQADQRRSRRYRVRLPVDLTQEKRTTHHETIDVSRHGLFITSGQTLPERFLFRLAIHLADGPLFATAFVSRTVSIGEPGLGLELFALSAGAKLRWDRTVARLGSAAEPGRRLLHAAGGARPSPGAASYLIKLPTVAQLGQLYEKVAGNGTLYLVTPVIREIDAEVAIVVIHPVTDQEYTLIGRVLRVNLDKPRGLELKLSALDPDALEVFRRFAESGRGLPIDSQIPGLDEVALFEPAQRAAPTAPIEDEASISIDIEVDLSQISPEDRFTWDGVVDDLIIDLDLSDFESPSAPTAVAHRDVRPEEPDIPIDEPEEDSTALLAAFTAALDASPPMAGLSELTPREAVALICVACRAAGPVLQLGPLRGPAAGLIEQRPFWCPRCARLIALPRLRSVKDRRATLTQLSKEALAAPIALGLLFEVAELAGSPRCPTCGATARSTDLCAALEDALTAGAETVALEQLPCRACRGDRWSLSRSS